ncbi:hypothetical protein K431DRAFT_89837 [Polychaeton citri CBS 116435]|uniref:Fucose-specific lectin n=1 Tax=Polychaeton citri CBS 116435 TaxID=1314669 RepID=A0A9P4Q4R1_9PEZI|nr:hypothetical protein K431DRAFT_89837 [Polychaeton citri CBS 116435]
MDFTDSVRNMWMKFPESDQDSGVSCVLADNFNHLYLRNSTTKAVQQWQWDYVDVSNWVLGPRSATNASTARGSDIAAANDGSGTDYVLWTSPNGALIRGMYLGRDSDYFQGYATDETASPSSKMSASFVGGGVEVWSVAHVPELD